MLSSATDAEDIVQEAFVRWLQADVHDVQSPKAFLSTIVVRLCLDQLRSARARREVYVGPWLPEPIATGSRPELTETVEMAESISYAFLIMLESLQPLERAVFLLREVFDYDYAEIAPIVGKSEANCRQIFHRARQRLGHRDPRFHVPLEQAEHITEQFARASLTGDINGLLELLAEDVVFMPDTGGKVAGGRNPVKGKSNVSRGMLGALAKLGPGLQGRIEQVNGQPAIVGYLNGDIYGVILLGIREGKVQYVYTVMNPDKLRWLTG
jgi:RNA polymerase sigma-70 factor (ECF subfamily)